MSLVQLIPIINDLSQPDKLELFKLLAAQIPESDLQVIFSATEYPVGSPYESTEAADIMKQMIKGDRAISVGVSS
jgi:hypothetical protein